MALLKVSGLKKNFGKLEVLKGIDFELERGKALSIIGSSGSGKTTLLRCLNFLETPNEGTISIDDEVIFDASMAKKLTDAEMRTRRLRFGLVFQSFNLFPQYTVFDNLTLAPKLRLKAEELSKEDKKIRIEQINTRAQELLARIGLTEKADYYPCQLSGGQQQRVAIARALALSPDILCFDEPTSALDPELTGEVLNVIKDLKNQDHTMIIVTHEMEFAKNVSDQVIFMADGVIEEMGTPEQIFQNPVSPVTRAFLNKSLENF
jgi:polar amino acid transport system ATP-binding protein